MNSVIVTVFYVLRALHRRIIVHRILSKMQRIRASLSTAIYDNKQSDCLLSRSQRLIGLTPRCSPQFLIMQMRVCCVGRHWSSYVTLEDTPTAQLTEQRLHSVGESRQWALDTFTDVTSALPAADSTQSRNSRHSRQIIV